MKEIKLLTSCLTTLVLSWCKVTSVSIVLYAMRINSASLFFFSYTEFAMIQGLISTFKVHFFIHSTPFLESSRTYFCCVKANKIRKNLFFFLFSSPIVIISTDIYFHGKRKLKNSKPIVFVLNESFLWCLPRSTISLHWIDDDAKKFTYFGVFFYFWN